MYQLIFYVPRSHLDIVKTALFNAGAGRMGHYDHCAWQTLGNGQFRPLSASQPYIGTVNKRESLEEYRVEMVCAAKRIKSVLQALLAVHPYETPAYAVFEMKTLADF